MCQDLICQPVVILVTEETETFFYGCISYLSHPVTPIIVLLEFQFPLSFKIFFLVFVSTSLVLASHFRRVQNLCSFNGYYCFIFILQFFYFLNASGASPQYLKYTILTINTSIPFSFICIPVLLMLVFFFSRAMNYINELSFS